MTPAREHLKAARKARGWTAFRLAGETGIGEQKIFSIERGRYLPTRGEAIRWATALDMDARCAFPQLFDDGKGAAQ